MMEGEYISLNNMKNIYKTHITISDEISVFICGTELGDDIILHCNYKTSCKQASGIFHIRGDILRAMYIMHGDLTKFPPRNIIENPGTDNGYLMRNVVVADLENGMTDFYIIQKISNDSHADQYAKYGCHPLFKVEEWVKLQDFLREQNVKCDMDLINVNPHTIDIFIRGFPQVKMLVSKCDNSDHYKNRYEDIKL